MTKQRVRLALFDGIGNADILGGGANYEFGLGHVDFEVLVENINGTIGLATGNRDVKLRLSV